MQRYMYDDTCKNCKFAGMLLYPPFRLMTSIGTELFDVWTRPLSADIMLRWILPLFFKVYRAYKGCCRWQPVGFF